MSDRLADFRKKFTELLEMPKDVVLDLPRITMLGDLEVEIVNHKGILSYTPERVVVTVVTGTVTITGRGLSIASILKEEITVVGHIRGIEFNKQ
ncbi:MAG: sporulation protein YqfC [Bacillota bacterium]